VKKKKKEKESAARGPKPCAASKHWQFVIDRQDRQVSPLLSAAT
jgi:hypothetical protein